ncbi:hypothetical protein G1H11_18770 [Phytoactinopolyspora alkaliphila]|uniref:Uncharacterized protein n=1 Tax=Phytoactinopolyspora alkaliphila TaxID=1783498 RepID=A0A6N9YQU3_9ACTN|nr:hypothetical protein [Phytoactinopolyspora alkaliphila]NED97344.1 hypothetical protein [Phytoactinopolyspora alkaliphila]
MNDYSSISAEGMGELVTAMRRGHGKLSTDLDDLRTKMRIRGVTFQTLSSIDTIAEWVDAQLPGLERRRNMAEALTGDRPEGTMVQFDEPIPFDSPEEAEQYGRELAQQLLEDGTIDAGTFDEMFEEMEAYVNDPDVMAGFYLELGPDYAGRLPSLLQATGSDNAERYLELFSIGLGTALNTTDHTSSSSDYYSEFSDFREQWRDAHDDPALSWDRLAMLQHGDFPPRWLSDVVRNAVLEDFEGEDWGEIDFRSGFTPRLGLSEDTLALAFSALGNNPSAARIALDEQGGISIEEYVERVYGIQRSRGTGDAITEAFGQAIASGSGALDDPPDKGSHASSFAFQAIVALGQHEDTPWGMREPMGQIAAAYAEELLVGSYAHDATFRGSSMDMPENFDLPPGMDPNFFLSPEDVYRFLHGFAHDDRYSADFDAAVQDLYETLPAQALEADLAATGAGDLDPENFEAALRMFGTLSGLQYQAQREVRGDEFDEEEAFKANMAFGGSAVLTLLPVSPKGILDLGWKVTQVVTAGSLNEWAASGTDPRDELDALNIQAGVLHRYLIAEMMIDAGYPTTQDIPPDLLDENGNLRDPVEISEDLSDGGLAEQFVNWTDSANEIDPDHPNTRPFDNKFDSGWDAIGNGRGDVAEQIVNNVDW